MDDKNLPTPKSIKNIILSVAIISLIIASFGFFILNKSDKAIVRAHNQSNLNRKILYLLAKIENKYEYCAFKLFNNHKTETNISEKQLKHCDKIFKSIENKLI
ncbi:hypothetical protein FHQ18_07520 [Deferribacter autotrophicus]|uniref:Uncharacterized protein n=1 Tax=Deferribacter autotrophicus TaxID=500465 RepID=A0A5A8F357_9BACT|nr:hypothetical protein [Deferribacter autotrophicus]KAA0258233.1 hypothetical protein FHQ18_07520 [Deferribacter autotrophicus]